MASWLSSGTFLEAMLLTLRDLVANHSVTDAGADVLRSIGAAGRPFLVYALPRNAGKTTVTQAILAEAPESLPRDEFFGTEDEVASLIAAPTRGYLTVGEIGHRGQRGYLAGEAVPRLFDVLSKGYSLASSLHADSVDGVFDVLRTNGVPSPVAAAAIDFVVKVHVLGDPRDDSTPRVVDQIHEITAGDDGEPTGSLLYQWEPSTAS
jgi:hypothetical protein